MIDQAQADDQALGEAINRYIDDIEAEAKKEHKAKSKSKPLLSKHHRSAGACVWHLRHHCRETGYKRELARRRNPIEKKLRKFGIYPAIGKDYESSLPCFPVNCDIIYDYPRKRWYQYFYPYGYFIIPHYSIRYDHWRDTWFQFIGNDLKPTEPPKWATLYDNEYDQ